MTRFKKITKNRAITIPKDLAAEFGITGGEGIEISCTDGTITIRKRAPKCRICGDVREAISIRGIVGSLDLCPVCADSLKEEFND
ncbi:MAG: AbrB/MazE/SpoVT family DNA-binding domain-containing protein [Oscillospiraceae bacterium]|nr:AbrB/MazE/SpoVT family DNA-binding domain-containing protein [Oscillospiraceae bacterium]